MNIKNSEELEKKEDNKGSKKNINVYLIIGLLLYMAYTLTNRFFIVVADALAYPWMIVSCICMLIGVYRTGKELGNKRKK